MPLRYNSHACDGKSYGLPHESVVRTADRRCFSFAAAAAAAAARSRGHYLL